MAAEMTDKDPATISLSGEAEKKQASKESLPETREVNIHQRDPANINDYVKIKFHDVFAEPDEEVFSFDRIWELSFKVFTQTKMWCYRITSIILALPLTVCWALYFGCLAFCNIWCCVPLMKGLDIECMCIRKIWGLIINICCVPIFDAYGRCCSRMKLNVQLEKV